MLVVPALSRDVGPTTIAADAVRGLLAMAGGALVASGVFHGVLGAHLASKVTSGPLDPDLVRLAELVHAVGDTFWFVGVGALTATTAIVVTSQSRAPHGSGLAVGIRNHVVNRERTSEQRIIAARDAGHYEVARNNLSGDFRTFEADAVGVAREPEVFDDRHARLAGRTRADCGLQRHLRRVRIPHP